MSTHAARLTGTGSQRPGPRARRLAVSLAVLVAAALGGILAAGSGSGAAHREAAAGGRAHYGGLPSWLPKPKHLVRRELSASPGHPALSIQGEPVAVSLGQGASVTATAVGPEVPEEGRFPVPATSPVTFVVTFAAAHGSVPLRAGQFVLVDGLGDIHHPRVRTLAGGPMPAQVPSGQPLTLRLHTVMPTGEGALEWKPLAGRPLAGWDFTVEID